ncbi:MAG: HEAT repeat domain-containing protein [Polyangiales bacterium]
MAAGLPAVVCWSVANALGAQGERGVAPALRYLDDPDLALFACAALGRTRSLAAIDPLAGALDGEKRAMVREAAAEALGMIHDARAAEALARHLDDAEPGVRRNAALSLHSMGARGVAAVAPHLSRGGVAATQAAYVMALSGGVPEACGPALVALLTVGDAMTWAATALEKTPGGVALAAGRVSEWLALVEGGEGAWAAAAAWSLAWLARRRPAGFDDGQVERLVRALASRDGYVRARVSEAAVALAPRGLDAVRALARGDDAAARGGAVEALAQRAEAEPGLTEVFAEALADEGCAVWAAHALERIGPSARAAVERAGARHGGEAAVRARRLLERWG